MKKAMVALVLALLSLGIYAQEQNEQKVPTPEEMAAKEADRLADVLKLEYWQVFYVDSTLQHDFAAYQEEVKKLQTARVDNYDIYTLTYDKWMEQIDRTYKKIFTPEQWAAYLKSGAAKAQKAREKRKAKIDKATAAQLQKAPQVPDKPSSPGHGGK